MRNKTGKLSLCTVGHISAPGARFCSECGAPLREVATYFAKWDEVQKQYQVRLVFLEKNLTLEREEYFQNLGAYIASESTCSCGTTLTPLNYTLQKDEEQIIFEGIYVCNKCTREKLDNNYQQRQHLDELRQTYQKRLLITYRLLI